MAASSQYLSKQLRIPFSVSRYKESRAYALRHRHEYGLFGSKSGNKTKCETQDEIAETSRFVALWCALLASGADELSLIKSAGEIYGGKTPVTPEDNLIKIALSFFPKQFNHCLQNIFDDRYAKHEPKFDYGIWSFNLLSDEEIKFKYTLYFRMIGAKTFYSLIDVNTNKRIRDIELKSFVFTSPLTTEALEQQEIPILKHIEKQGHIKPSRIVVTPSIEDTASVIGHLLMELDFQTSRLNEMAKIQSDLFGEQADIINDYLRQLSDCHPEARAAREEALADESTSSSETHRLEDSTTTVTI
ncbi:hypothetical protein [Legionella sp. CNM-4043-24]|uniref:hypothetical protein n=1 Tax=Legionella sp. CNM-4043-24 TaxID=3421646 RepID=UPI00403AB68B